MKTIKIRNIPQWSICYLTYGDDRGLTTENRRQANDFLLDLHKEGWRLSTPIQGSETAFCRFPLFGNACASVDFEAYKFKKREPFKTKKQKENFAKLFHFAN
jgi:hypothetical protein